VVPRLEFDLGGRLRKGGRLRIVGAPPLCLLSWWAMRQSEEAIPRHPLSFNVGERVTGTD